MAKRSFHREERKGREVLLKEEKNFSLSFSLCVLRALRGEKGFCGRLINYFAETG